MITRILLDLGGLCFGIAAVIDLWGMVNPPPPPPSGWSEMWQKPIPDFKDKLDKM